MAGACGAVGAGTTGLAVSAGVVTDAAVATAASGVVVDPLERNARNAPMPPTSMTMPAPIATISGAALFLAGVVTLVSAVPGCDVAQLPPVARCAAAGAGCGATPGQLPG